MANTNVNTPVATMDVSGRVTGRVPGTANITAVCCSVPPTCMIQSHGSVQATVQVSALKPHYAYAATLKSLSVYPVDPATGGVTLVGPTAAPAGVLKLDPTGDFAILAGPPLDVLSASTYLADGNSGMLQLAGSGVFFRHPESASWAIELPGRSVYDFATIDFCGIEEYSLDV